MIPDPSYPTYESANRAMQMSDAFVQQARMQAQAQMYQQQMAFTGGQGGGQPGIMAYAAGAGSRFMGGMASGISGQMSQFMGGLGTAAGVGAVVAQPMFGQMGNVLEGSRYTGAGARESFSSLLATAYAPLSLFPQAGTSFGMEQGLRRQMAREETGRRMTQAGRGTAVALMDAHTLGLGSYFMRRSGSDVAYLGEQERERSVQQRLGFLRGGQYGGSEGVGVGREYLTQGAGRELMRGMRESERGLQHSYGLSREQMGTIRDVALGAVDTTRIQQAGAGGHRGMGALGREMGEIGRQAAAMSREMQLTEPQLKAFMDSMKSVMKVTGESIRSFNEENRRTSSAGPFSAAQVGQFRTQAMGVGQQLFMNAPSFASDAMRQAQQVSDFRRSGVISSSTLLREGGGLDADAMMRMTMARVQQQAGLVQGGNFNQALLLASQNKGGYGAMLGGASFFETQGAAAATVIANPWAMLQARMDPSAVQRVTMSAPAIAFMQSQQRQVFMQGNNEAVRAQKIASFGRQMGMDMTTAQGASNARIRFEELEEMKSSISDRLRDRTGDEWQRAATTGKMSSKALGDTLFGFAAETGASGDASVDALEQVMIDPDLSRAWAGANTRAKKSEVLERGATRRQAIGEKSALNLADDKISAIKKIGVGGIMPGSPGNDMRNAAADVAKGLAAAGLNNEAIVKKVFGSSANYLSPYTKGTPTETKIVSLGGGKFETMSRKLKISGDEITEAVDAFKKKAKVRIPSDKQMVGVFTDWAASKEAEGKSPWEKWEKGGEVEWGDVQFRNLFRAATGRGDGETLEEAEGRVGLERKWSKRKGDYGGTLGLLAEAGVGVEGSLSDVAGKLPAALDKLGERVKGDRRLAPLLQVASQMKDGRFENVNFEKASDVKALRGYFKTWAVTDEGKKLTAGIGVSQMSVGDMQGTYKMMSEAAQKNLTGSFLLSAMEKSQRTMTKEDRGSFTEPQWVLDKAAFLEGKYDTLGAK